MEEEKIFLSYHSSKVELVEHLAKYLERNGIKSWYAARDIRSGEEWDESIHSAIRNCTAVVLLFCSQADASVQVKREMSLADKYKKPVFWVRVERVEPNNLSYFLSATQWLDWMDMRDITLEKLVQDIKSVKNGGEVAQDNSSPTDDMTAFQHAKKHGNWAKGVIALDSVRDIAECAARVYFCLGNKFPDGSLVLPTGRSATQLFRAMIRIVGEYDGCPFGEAHLISDTETFGVWSGHETSRTRHINEMLIEPLQEMGKAPQKSQLHLLSGIYTDSDPVKNAQKVIRMYPPVVHAVSVSPLGEILAYEVGTYNDTEDIINDAPKIVEVGEHSKKYIDPNQPSKSIITIGMGTALSADVLLILAFDLQKAGILHRLFNGTITAGIPATILRNHPNAYVLTTRAVAKEAEIEDYVSDCEDAKEAAEWIISN